MQKNATNFAPVSPLSFCFEAGSRLTAMSNPSRMSFQPAAVASRNKSTIELPKVRKLTVSSSDPFNLT